MEEQEFIEYVQKQPALMDVYGTCQVVMPKSRSLLNGPESYMLIGILYPATKYILINFGLPWLNGLKKWHDLKVAEFYKYIDDKFANEGLNNLDEVKKAGEKLYEEIRKLNDPSAQKQWETLFSLLTKEKN